MLPTRRATPDLRKLSSIEKIRVYLNPDYDEIKLTDQDKELYDRCKTILSLCRKHGSPSKVVKEAAKHTEISERQMWRDYKKAITLLPHLNSIPKDIDRALTIERYFKYIQEAQKAKDRETVYKYEALIAKIKGLDIDDLDIIDPEDLVPHTYISDFIPDLTGVEVPDDLDEQLALLMKTKKKKNLNELDIQDAEIIDNE